MSFKPMLAAKAEFDKLTFPVYASPKLDGVRCAVIRSKPLSRTLKPIPNVHINNVFTGICADGLVIEGLDGELIVGDPTAPNAYQKTVSGVMSEKGAPDFTYWVFDLHDMPARFDERIRHLQEHVKPLAPVIKVLPHVTLRDMHDLERYESEQVARGFEGVILRAPEGPYKCGRSTVNEGYMLKVKRFIDSEALIVGVEEEMHNTNEATKDELGRTKRSTAKAGLVPKGVMGKLVVRDIVTGVEFRIGTGFDAEQRKAIWRDRDAHINKSLVKYKSFPIGVKDLPRHPVFLGFRSKEDM